MKGADLDFIGYPEEMMLKVSSGDELDTKGTAEMNALGKIKKTKIGGSEGDWGEITLEG